MKKIKFPKIEIKGIRKRNSKKKRENYVSNLFYSLPDIGNINILEDCEHTVTSDKCGQIQFQMKIL